jgi:GLPGLI family protein
MQSVFLKINALIILLNCISFNPIVAQKVFNDGMIQYRIAISGEGDQSPVAAYFKDATMNYYLKSHHTRMEIKTGIGNTITIADEKTGESVMLNEYGNQKMLVRLNAEQAAEANKKNLNPNIEYTTETKTVAGYLCKHAIIRFENGTTFSVYYAPDLKFQSTNSGIPTKNIGGFPLEYEAEISKLKVTYQAVKISTDPVNAALFEVPTSGYREMKYDELPKN